MRLRRIRFKRGAIYSHDLERCLYWLEAKYGADSFGWFIGGTDFERYVEFNYSP